MKYIFYIDESWINGRKGKALVGGVIVHSSKEKKLRRKILHLCRGKGELKFAKIREDHWYLYKIIDTFMQEKKAKLFCLVMDKKCRKSYISEMYYMSILECVWKIFVEEYKKGEYPKFNIIVDRRNEKDEIELEPLKIKINEELERRTKSKIEYKMLHCEPAMNNLPTFPIVTAIEPKESKNRIMLQLSDLLIGALGRYINHASGKNVKNKKDAISKYFISQFASEKNGLQVPFETEKVTLSLYDPLNFGLYR